MYITLLQNRTTQLTRLRLYYPQGKFFFTALYSSDRRSIQQTLHKNSTYNNTPLKVQYPHSGLFSEAFYLWQLWPRGSDSSAG